MSGEVAFGVEIAEDRRRCSIVAAGRGASGLIVVDLVWYEHPLGAAKRIGELQAKHDPVAVVVDGRSQSGTLIRPLLDLGIVPVEPSAAEVAVAHGEFLDLVNDGGLEHLNQPPLTAAVRSSQQRALAGAQAWERRVAVDQSPLTAATQACWGFRRWEELSAPGVWVL